MIVAVFPWGRFKGVFGVEETVPVIAFIPLMLFAILFGLSMDYEVSCCPGSGRSISGRATTTPRSSKASPGRRG